MNEKLSLNYSSNWYTEYLSPQQTVSIKIREVLFSGKTKYQTVDIVESETYGRSLILDGKTQSTEKDEYIYHESLVSPAMLFHDNPVSVFIAGGGEGATLREVLNHRTVTTVNMVDLDEEIVELSKLYLPKHHKGAFEDPRLELHHTDARAYLQDNERKYDVIILDLVDPLEEGTAYQLYTKEFYEIVKGSLRKNGIMVTQSGSSDITNFTDCYVPIVHTIGTVFNHVSNYQVNISGFGMPWSFTVASQSKIDTTGPRDQKCKSRIYNQLKFYDYESHVHMFNVPKYVRDELKAETRINSDANPIFMT